MGSGRRDRYNRRHFLTVSAAAALSVSGIGGARARAGASDGPITVRVVPSGPGFTLLRDGKPYFIKGAGGSASLPKLQEAGGNSLRTWGADNLGPVLDEAQRLGLTVCVGIWLGHKEHGFHYDDPRQVAEQYERVRKNVLQWKNHPAVLVWGIGNEMEVSEGHSTAVWKAVEDAAKLVKSLDPNHPTMTVVAEMGPEKVHNINTLCPDIDIIGINSYGGAPSLPKRYAAAGGVKPYIVTEFGPPGTWETGRNAWGAAPELTSTQKAGTYCRAYLSAVKDQPLCLGSYAFTWGNKQEATATWYGLFLSDGSKLAGVDALSELWTGKPPATLCPSIDSLSLEGGADQVAPGATVKVLLAASDPQRSPLKVRWVLQKDPVNDSVGGDKQPVPPTYPDALVHSDEKSVEVKMPAAPGAYRLFAYVHNSAGDAAAVGNIPLFVKKMSGDGKAAALRRAKLPFTLLGGTKPGDGTYVPSGWMGDTKAIQMNAGSTDSPHSGTTCLECSYTNAEGWGGVVWQSPAGDWGEKPGGLDISGAKRLAFWARGAKGGEEIGFQFGLIGADKPYGDSAQGKEHVRLTTEWKEYQIDLAGKDLSRIKTGFGWVVAGQGKPITFYLDDIRYE